MEVAEKRVTSPLESTGSEEVLWKSNARVRAMAVSATAAVQDNLFPCRSIIKLINVPAFDLCGKTGPFHGCTATEFMVEGQVLNAWREHRVRNNSLSSIVLQNVPHGVIKTGLTHMLDKCNC